MKVTKIENGQVTVVVTWHVCQGHEQEFDAWFRDISAAALKFLFNPLLNQRTNGR